jgi:cytochrome P450
MEIVEPDLDFAHVFGEEIHPVLHRIRSNHGVARVRFHGEDAYIITRYADLEAAFRDESRLPAAAAYRIHSEPVQGRTLLCMEGEQHRVNRTLIMASFGGKSITQFAGSLLVPTANEIVDQFAAKGEAELVAEFTTVFPYRVIMRLLGVPPADEESLHRWSLGLMNYPYDPEGARRASSEFTDYLRPLVEERRTNPDSDLISALASSEVEGQRLSDEEIFSFVRLLFPAGADTSYLGIGSMLYALLSHPDALAHVIASPADRRWAIEESLRWESPEALLPRRTSSSYIVGETEVPADTPLLFATTAANRDPDAFPNPDEFDLGRRTTGSLTFGLGTHYCVGALLAKAEMAVALDVLVERLPNLRAGNGFSEESRVQGAVLRGPNTLPVVFDPAQLRRSA